MVEVLPSSSSIQKYHVILYRVYELHRLELDIQELFLPSKMFKLVLLGALASVALGMDLSGLMSMGNIQNLMSSLPPEVIENAMKNITPEKISEALDNPQLQEMMKGFGVSKEQVEEAVKKLPADMDMSKMANLLKDGAGEGFDQTKDALSGMGVNINELPEVVEEMKNKFKEDFGIDLDNDDSGSVVSKLKGIAIDKLKEEGVTIDPDDPEETQRSIIKRLKKHYNVDPEMNDNEFRSLIIRDLLIELQQEGFDIDPEKPEEAIEKLKTMALEKAKDLGFEINEDMDWPDIKDLVMDKMRDNGVPVDNIEEFVPFLMNKFKEYQPMIMEFIKNNVPSVRPQMRPMPMPIPIMRPVPIIRPMMQQRPPVAMPLTLNLEINVDEGDHPTTVGGMPFREYDDGLAEEEVMELLQDLLHFRSMAKNLIAQNQMLQHRLAALSMEKPVMSRSPMMAALMHRCKHDM